MPRGGPDGGSGGRGGSVVFQADESLDSLETYARKRLWAAPDGAPGARARKEGRSAEDLLLKVPVGTVVIDEGSRAVVADLDRPGASAVVAQGGAGGRGNVHFATPTQRAPRFSEPGQAGDERDLRLELKLIADVGLVGPPNAGKSSLLRAVSAARPKVASYPFTTLEPVLGVVTTQSGGRITLADIPGLIEGASSGAGLGLDFLRHLERTRALLWIVDGAAADPTSDLETVKREVGAYSRELAERPAVTAVNKIDLEASRRFRAKAPNRGWHFISALTGEGLPQLIEALETTIRQAPEAASLEVVPPVIRLRSRKGPKPVVEREPWGFAVHGDAVERLVARTDFDSDEGLGRFQVQLDRSGVSAALEEAGAKAGDTVRIGDREFEYQP